jgi:hypothetical protein
MPLVRLRRATFARLGFLAAIEVACALAAAPRMAHAEGVCRPLADIRAEVAAHGDGRWIELTPEQWQFSRGIFVLNPNTPPGLPYGDRAALIQRADDKGGLVLFLDGDRACEPMAMPADAIELLMRVGSGEITHEGTSN